LREPILGIAEDSQGSLWLSTSNHVLRVKRDALLHGALAEGDYREYGIADGLRGVEGVKRHRSVVTDPLGRVWFSMNAPVRRRSSAARRRFRTGPGSGAGHHSGRRGRENLAGTVSHPSSRRRITIGYAGLSLSVPERSASVIPSTDSIIRGANPCRAEPTTRI